MELDAFLSGGCPRGALMVWIAGTGGGKSMAMSHSASHSISQGMNVAYATLELPEAVVAARVKANLTGLPINSILDGKTNKAREMLESMKLGAFTVKEFTPHATALEDVNDWVKQIEDDTGTALDKLVVDYADKLISPGKDKSEYTEMRRVYEGLRVGAVDKKYVCETGCQSRGREEKKAKKIDLEHTSDSMHKVRVADIVVTENYNEDDNEMGFFVAKHRTGQSRRMIGPLPVDYACGRIAPVNRGPLPQGGGESAPF
jgi:KaiC/GvpD/RAD55 family RecA-like ATPase